MHQAIEEGPGRDDHGAGLDRAAVPQLDAANPPALGQQADYLGLFDVEVGLVLEQPTHVNAVELLVALRSRRPDCGPAAGVEQPELDADLVGDLPHHAAQRVDFAH